MFQYTPLLGAQSSSSATQSLLELDGGVKILINVGWDDDFDVEKLCGLQRHVQTLSTILLTHATPAHLGAFAHCCKHIPLFTQIPMYATAPVISLGRTLLQDIYSSTPLASTVIPKSTINQTISSSSTAENSGNASILLPPPTAEEIASYFALIHPLKYSQPHQPLPSPFSPPLNDLTITAYNAGHSLGGTIWHLQYGMESIVHAVDWNQVRENVFAGAAWLGSSGGAEVIEQLRKPTVLICSSRGSTKTALAGGRAKRDSLLLEMIRTAAEKGGVVLIPTDTSARVLELAYMLEHAWRKESGPSSVSPLKSAKLYLASRNIGATMRYVRSMLEWMDESVVREFESESMNGNNKQHRRGDSRQGTNQNNPRQRSEKSGGPFEFKYLRMLESHKRLDRLLDRSGPRVILASGSSLEWGFSKKILERIATNDENMVILTDNSGAANGQMEKPSGLKHTLWQWLRDGKIHVGAASGTDRLPLEQTSANGRTLRYTNVRRVPLEGNELSVYQQYLVLQRQNQSLSQMSKDMNIEVSADAVEDASSSTSSSDDDSDPEKQGKALNMTAKAARFTKSKAEPSKETLGVNVLLRYQGLYDYDVRDKKGRDQMFPALNKRRRADDFGDLIKPEDYLRAEERDEVDGEDMKENGNGNREALGQKRKWQETGLEIEYDANMKRQQTKHLANGGPVALDGTVEEEGSSADSEPEVEDNVAGPMRLGTSSHTVEAQLKVGYVDFAGIHDQRSLSMLIPLIQPKKLILVGGDPAETTYLAQECRQKLGFDATRETDSTSGPVMTPIVGQSVEASVDTNAWTVKLSEALTRQLHWQSVKGLGVVTLAGHLAANSPEVLDSEDEKSRKKPKPTQVIAADDLLVDKTSPNLKAKVSCSVPLLGLLPPNIAAATRSIAQSLHVGDLRLADLRKLLQAAGHTAEFRGEGTLLIDDFVAVRKSATGRIEVEGGGFNMPDIRIRAGEGPFYAVKKRIYDGLAVIAGG